MLEVTRCKSAKEAQEKAAERINQILDAHAHVPTLLLLSGGSSLELADRIWVFPPNLTLGMTDERFSQDPKVNNFAQLCSTSFFQKAQEKGAYFIDTRVQQGEDMEAMRQRFENSLQQWKAEHPGGRIVITQGVGKDAHTLGIMPFAKDKDRFSELFEGASWVQGYDAGNKSEHSLRITITLPFLRQVDHSVVYMVGEEKKEALARTLKTEGMLHETPSRIIHEMKEVMLFTNIQE